MCNMNGASTLRRSPRYLNLRAAAGQSPAFTHPNAAKSTPETSYTSTSSPSVPVSAARNLSDATSEAVIPKPLAQNNKGNNRDTVPFPAFDDDFSSNLLEPAVQVQFNTIDWAGSSGRGVKGEQAVSPRSSSAGLGSRCRRPVAERASLANSWDAVKTPIVSGSSSRRNAIIVVQVSDQNGMTVSTPEAQGKTNDETAMLLTMHGFAYDLRSPRVTSRKQGRSGKRSKMATLKGWWRRMIGR